MEPEDEVPAGSFKIIRRPREKAPLWALPVLIVGFVILAAGALAAGKGTVDGFAEARAYAAAPTCTLSESALSVDSGFGQCPSADRIAETVTVVAINPTIDTQGDETDIEVVFLDPSGTVPPSFPDGSGAARFSSANKPPFDSSALPQPELQAEVYGGAVQWMRETASGPRYQPDGSVQAQTADAALPLLAICLIEVAFSCFGWWLLVRRGASSDQDVRRPILLLATAIVGAVAWEMCDHHENAGVTVYFVAMLLAVFLAVPNPPRRWLSVLSPSSWPRLVRTRRSDRGGKRGHDEIFR